ncbi:MAG: energy transducer TonB [Saprospiraceae bacterium]
MSKKDLSPLQASYYEGGNKAMDEHVKANLVYPPLAIEKKIEGTVHLFLDIDNKGNVIKVKVISGIGHGCDEEAVRVVKLMKFKVEKIRNMHVIHHQKLQIHFRLGKETKSTIELPNSIPQATPTENNVVYNFTPKVKKEIKTPAPKTVYTYQITM